MISQLFISYSFGGLILKVEFQSPFLYFDREFGDRCFYVNYNLRLNIGILPLCCKKVFDYEGKLLYLVKIYLIQKFPENSPPYTFKVRD